MHKETKKVLYALLDEENNFILGREGKQVRAFRSPNTAKAAITRSNLKNARVIKLVQDLNWELKR